ncbi:hypothetical protein [Nocardia sp. alder85J]|uniref:hypothetical protein n=1 Tax=Nocardia sp. alder85J TaxID=2862949 RepID=UPI00225ADE6D|nr:hypothetical protein [Nocardia sp. alder85J]MCX4096687.1 hypothetical protein [Nocardia sp. alder85J]
MTENEAARPVRHISGKTVRSSFGFPDSAVGERRYARPGPFIPRRGSLMTSREQGNTDRPVKPKSKITITMRSKESTNSSKRVPSSAVSRSAPTVIRSGTAEQLPSTPQATAHLEWLMTYQSLLKADTDLAAQWSPHRKWSAYVDDRKLDHFVAFDGEPGHQYIWRFTSLPSKESVSIAADTGLSRIIKVIGEHSGGNMKTDEQVRTSSFCRNIGALFGIAASTGGDKKVLNIVNRTPYLCRIDLATLPAKGVTAAPALYRAISLFETEYVLVPTPKTTYFLTDTGGNVVGDAGCLDAVLSTIRSTDASIRLGPSGACWSATTWFSTPIPHCSSIRRGPSPRPAGNCRRSRRKPGCRTSPPWIPAISSGSCATPRRCPRSPTTWRC